ncbi:phosphoribosylglycinamide formyltransferase [Stutzerimonas nitrititolerans]|uniref:phosphoribosylglycinamide formyltransferase n=1 Tax=Stutzerimonas nitrititolerans TaxID=2482751 RepID=UPI000E91D405|nr:phosphoribosylglycinamide formyltransferase [Stutzerimonas nitrititolerans]RRV19935.1 phosphoribosylglycinamide formyltransferase [Pseudomonas sp. s199]HAQ72638.1 phosphoribosylglycinamide formyltransferase [Pseudomonas sp.]
MTVPCNVVVLISGSGSNLQALIDSLNESNPARIRAVISNRAEAFGLQRAQAAGIDTRVIDHKQFADRDAFDAALMEHIDAYAPQLVVLAGFMRILTPAFVRHYQGRLLNIHPSLLPRHKGLDTHRRALEAGDSEHGCSVHFVTEELDGGPVAIQAAFTVRPEEGLDALTSRVHTAEHVIYPLAVRWFAEGRLRLCEQGAMLDGAKLPATGHPIRT